MLHASQHFTAVASALGRVQAELAPVPREGVNPDIRGRYVTMADVWEAARPLLAREGLAVTHGIEQENGRVTVSTLLIHGESGEWLGARVTLPVLGRWAKGGAGRLEPDAQAVGSAITYGRRYGLSAVLGVVAEEDDDGRKASQAGGRPASGEPRGELQGLATTPQRDLIARLIKSHHFERKVKLHAKVEDMLADPKLSRQMASEVIDHLQAGIKKGNEAEAAARPEAEAGDAAEPDDHDEEGYDDR